MSCPNDLEFVLWGYLAGVLLVLIAILASAIRDHFREKRGWDDYYRRNPGTRP